MTRHVYTYENPTSDKDLREVCEVLAQGGVVAYPTDVNWAFGCDAAQAKAVDCIRLLKPRHPKEQPFSLLCCDIAMAAQYVNIDGQVYKVLRRAFPGPFTVLLNRSRSVVRQLRDKRRLVGIRIPDRPMLLDFVARFGRPLVTASIPPEGFTRFGDLTEVFGYQVFEAYGHGLDLILDLGQGLPLNESTVVDYSSGFPQLVRLGAGDPGIFGIS